MGVIATAGGRRLAYEESGIGPPLVLIMGLGAAADAWRDHVAAWAGDFRCIAVDNRGTGGSWAPPGPYTTADMADDYAALIDDLRIGPARVAGISMGGAIAQELALRRPDLVERLVLISTWAHCEPHTAQTFRNLAAVRAQADPATFIQLLQLWIWAPSWFATHSAELLAERAAAGAGMSREAFEAQVHACVTHDTRERLDAIEAPTLVTVGSEDVFTPRRYADVLAHRIPKATLTVFEGGAHTHHWELLSRFNETVRSWLR